MRKDEIRQIEQRIRSMEMARRCLLESEQRVPLELELRIAHAKDQLKRQVDERVLRIAH